MAGLADLRVAVLCCRGPFQYHLLRRVEASFQLVGAVFHHDPSARASLGARLSKYLHPKALAEYVLARARLPKFDRRASELARALLVPQAFTDVAPTLPVVEVTDVNHGLAIEHVRALKPDIVLVNGTNLLRRPMLALQREIPLGFVNLHTGLSPYSRGGNCNLFMLLERQPQWMGTTVHCIDGGIDRGDILLSAHSPMEADDCYEMIDVREFHHGIEDLMRAVELLVSGRAQRIRQWEHGKLFLKRTGYVYRPYLRLVANRLIASGLLRAYLAERAARDAEVRVVRPPT